MFDGESFGKGTRTTAVLRRQIDPPARQDDIAVIKHCGLPGRDRRLRLIETDGELIGRSHRRDCRLRLMVVTNLRLTAHFAS